ncbi:MAG: Hpt domain-containing protein [Planctomycetaceae bacterium]
MSGSSLTGMSDMSLLELFREEVRTHGGEFVTGLTALRHHRASAETLAQMMRAAHSIKGAGRIVNVEPAVRIAGALEDVMRDAMKGTLAFDESAFQVLERGMELLTEIARVSEDKFNHWLPEQNPVVSRFFADLTASIAASISRGAIGGGALTAEYTRPVDSRDVSGTELAAGHSPKNVDPELPVASAMPLKASVRNKSLLPLFREEVGSHTTTMLATLATLEQDPRNPQLIEPLLRATHSIKGASRIVNVEPAVQIATALEDALNSARKEANALQKSSFAVLRRGLELLSEMAKASDDQFDQWQSSHDSAVRELLAELNAIATIRRDDQAPGEPEGVSPRTGTRVGGLTASGSPASMVRGLTPSGSPASVNSAADRSLLQLFREEVRDHAARLSEGLVALEGDPRNSQLIEPLMRAAHSIKGAARIVNLEAAVQVAHVMEDVLVTAQKGTIQLTPSEIDLLLRGVDLLSTIAASSEAEFANWLPSNNRDINTLLKQLADVAQGKPAPAKAVVNLPDETISRRLLAPGSVQQSVLSSVQPSRHQHNQQPAASAFRPSSQGIPAAPLPTMVLESVDVLGQSFANPQTAPREERVVRVTAQSLSRLMSLAGESLVEARWLQPFAKSLFLLKQNQDQLAVLLSEMQQSVTSKSEGGRSARLLNEAQQRVGDCRRLLADRIGVFEQHARQSDDLNSRLYYEVIASRMRPFSDGVQGFPRMVRDLARRLGKKVKFEVHGHNTDVDRDILEKLEAPLNHLLRNALDHGLETPEQRTLSGKAEQGTLRLEARHRAGMLQITISDDGSGISLERLRRKIVERGLSTNELVASMTEQELVDFLFLPGFSTSERVTEVSGRGVGLDVVHSMVTAVGGTVRVASKAGRGTTFHLQLPITLSVLRAVMVMIGGEPYALPHNRIDGLRRLPRREIRTLEGRQFFSLDGRNVGLVMAQQVLELEPSATSDDDLCVVLISDHQSEFGVVLDSFQGEQDLVVRPLDARLGKVANISAAALLEDGSPVLIVDVDDFLRSIDNLLKRGQLRQTQIGAAVVAGNRKRILVVDDSITVREAERQLLTNRGYEVAVAVDGMDGWKAIRDADFDLVVSDIDMPRMNGLEFVKNIKQDARLRHTPVVIVSYKGREEDRLRGLEAGADYYLSKGSFHDDSLLDAVVDLIGGPQ